MEVPVVVVTHDVPTDWFDAHPDAPFSFATAGVEAAVARAQEIAGDRVVPVTAGTTTRQCLELGLIDEVAVDLVPVVMSEGRPFFGKLSLEHARSAIQGLYPGRCRRPGWTSAWRAYPMRSTSSSSDTAASYKAIGGLPQ